MAQDESTGAGRTGMRRWQKVLLFGSLAVNLLIVGAVAGAILRGGPLGGPGPGARDGRGAEAPYTRAFTDAQRREIRRQLGRAFRQQGDKAAERDALAADYRKALALLRADTFEPERLTALIDRQSARGESRRQIGQEVLSAYIATMSPAERLAFADRLEDGIEQFMERRRRLRD